MKILLVEPDKVLGEATLASLQADNYQVSWCRSAQAALDNLDRQVPDVIILELQLGIHNGIEFLYEVRSYPEWQFIPVIIHTINANVLDERFVMPLKQLGVEKILYKPRTTAKKLVQAIGQYITL